MSWASAVVGTSVVAEDSPVETDRFGLSITRAVVPLGVSAESGFGETLGLLREADADVVVLRYPAERVDWFARLFAAGRDLVFADSLTYWRLRVGTGRPVRQAESDPHIEVSRGTTIEPGLLDSLIDDIFSDYGNHYRANPLLAPDKALAGYREWAQHSATHDELVTLSYQNDGIVGLATVESTPEYCEILLAGIGTQFQQRGLYAHLLAGCEALAAAKGVEELVISTQGHNTNVQRSWARFGFEPVGTLLTIHAVRKGLLPSIDVISRY